MAADLSPMALRAAQASDDPALGPQEEASIEDTPGHFDTGPLPGDELAAESPVTPEPSTYRFEYPEGNAGDAENRRTVDDENTDRETAADTNEDARETEAADNETPCRETSDPEPAGSDEPDKGVMTGEETPDDETADDETADDETADDETADCETADDAIPEDAMTDEETPDDEFADDETADCETADDETDQMADDPTGDEVPAEDETADPEMADDQPAEDETDDPEMADDQPAEDETADPEMADDQPAEDENLQDDCADGEEAAEGEDDAGGEDGEDAGAPGDGDRSAGEDHSAVTEPSQSEYLGFSQSYPDKEYAYREAESSESDPSGTEPAADADDSAGEQATGSDLPSQERDTSIDEAPETSRASDALQDLAQPAVETADAGERGGNGRATVGVFADVLQRVVLGAINGTVGALWNTSRDLAGTEWGAVLRPWTGGRVVNPWGRVELWLPR